MIAGCAPRHFDVVARIVGIDDLDDRLQWRVADEAACGRELFGYMGHGVAPCFVGLIELLACMNVVPEVEFDAVSQIALFWPSGAALAAQLRTLERKRRIERLERQIVQVR